MVCLETVPELFELFPQLDVIVDLAVKCDNQLAVQSGHRLSAGSKIDDGKAPMSKEYLLIDPDTRAVGSAMSEGIDHALQIRSFPPSYKAGDSAHGLASVRRSRFAVQGLEFRVWSLEFGVPGLEFGARVLGNSFGGALRNDIFLEFAAT